MHNHDSKIKNFLRGIVKRINKRKYDSYVNTIKERSKNLPDFTLFTSDCMAGLIYHTMGRQFLSPTINMSIKDEDFLKLLMDLQYYFSQEIRFVDSQYYPIGYIGEDEKKVTINFEHYKTNQEASQKWNERKTRIIENVFVVIADQDFPDKQIDTFKHLGQFLPIKRKIMFTWNKERADNKEIFYVKNYGRDRIKKWSRLRKDGFRDYEIFFDYVAWLNMEDNFILDQ
ncbi:MAG: DUF1919 domain-containing protein [Lachnospiraceae bacterium]|nr:DUF1919 domain-containing protein [Lachnospiraceae bacterium]